MIRLSDIPLFTGDGSQDADKWQQDFLSSTGHYGDEAVARLFISKLAIGSPAHTLVDSLPDPIKTSWFKLERVFRTEWLPSRRVEAPKQDPWEAFEKHVLTEEMIFGGSKNGDSTSSPSGVIVAWVDEHLRLGRNTGGTDDCLVRMTKLLLPVFIRTVISLKPKPETFTDICALIRQTPHDVLEMERTRYYETSRREERLSAMERKLEEITQRIDGLSNSANASSKATFSSHSVTNHVGEVPPSSPFVVPPQPVPPPPLQATVTPKTSSIINAPESQPSPVEVEATQSILPSRPRLKKGRKTAPTTSTPFPTAVPILTPANINKDQTEKDEDPDTWKLRNPEAMISKGEQLNIAQKAIDSMLKYLMGSYVLRGLSDDQWQDVWSALAIHDKMMCSIVNKARVEDALSKYCSPYVSRSYWLDRSRILWGISLIHGFQSYGNSEYLEVAKEHWNTITSRLITKDQATARRHISTCLDDIQLHQSADGSTSLSGGVFKDSFEGTEIAAFETTLYMSLSAHLSKCTGDTYYLDTAVLTANCIKNYMIDSESDVVKDCTVDAWNGKVAESGNPSVFLTGVFLEGLSILASASGDEAWRQLSLKIANASMKMAKWHRNGWILSPTAGYSGSADAVTNSKGILIRGLRHVWNQDPHDSASRTSIQRYINVQYNALLDYARIGNYYSNEWTKPTIEPSAVGQMAALDVVSAAIEVNQS